MPNPYPRDAASVPIHFLFSIPCVLKKCTYLGLLKYSVQDKVLWNSVQRDLSFGQSVASIHGAVLALAACVLSVPYDMPRWLPEHVTLLAYFVGEPSPVKSTVTKAVAEFRRTHADTWNFQKDSFTEEQLELDLLNGMIILHILIAGSVVNGYCSVPWLLDLEADMLLAMNTNTHILLSLICLFLASNSIEFTSSDPKPLALSCGNKKGGTDSDGRKWESDSKYIPSSSDKSVEAVAQFQDPSLTSNFLHHVGAPFSPAVAPVTYIWRPFHHQNIGVEADSHNVDGYNEPQGLTGFLPFASSGFELVPEGTSTVNLGYMKEDEDKDFSPSADISGKNAVPVSSTILEIEEDSALSDIMDLWDASKGILRPVEENFICMENHCQKLAFFCLGNTNLRKQNASTGGMFHRLCPILLLNNRTMAQLLRYFWGIEVIWSKEGINLSQMNYALDSWKESRLMGVKPIETPINPSLKLCRSSVINQFASAPHSTHMEAVLRIVRYLKGHLVVVCSMECMVIYVSRRSPILIGLDLLQIRDLPRGLWLIFRVSSYGSSIFRGVDF
ncbi:proteasome activating protein 200 [Actinidia rufa]|uniref:Proteasome activating protein 200 n=1 Tax=Actinidia rufa TaxID=165716 RepID=A0A7J0FLH7_9ERIC|nr:proteasome activating protein 200 [Actinidia rufa]